MNLLSDWARFAADANERRLSAWEGDDELALIDALEEATVLVRRHAEQEPEAAAAGAGPEGALADLWRSVAQDERGELLNALHAVNAALDREGLPRALVLFLRMQQGRLLVMHGDAVKAAPALLEGIDLARQLGALRQKARMLGNLGFLYGEVHGPAYEAYTRRALEIGRQLGDGRLIAHSLCNLGSALVMQDRLDEAEACLHEGLALAEALGWAYSIALFRAGIGGLRIARGQLDLGIASYAGSIAYFGAAGDAFQVSRQLLVVGRSLLQAGRADEAQATLERCLASAGPSTVRSPAWQALQLLSEIHEARGDANTALRLLRQSEAQRGSYYDEQFNQRLRMLELYTEAERSARLATEERDRVAALEAALQEANRLRAEIEQLVRIDTLTGLFNRRHINEVAGGAIALARRHGRPLVIALLDVDHFKAINDRFGHSVGDAVLVTLAGRLSTHLRSPDVMARWGGEEFAILLHEIDEGVGALVLGRLLQLLRARPLETAVGPVSVTASIGFTALRPADKGIDDLLHRADLALYAAKRAGRDRHLCFVDPAGPTG